MGQRINKEKKKATEELTRLRLENSRNKIEANDKTNEAIRLGRKINTLEKENNDLVL